MSDNLYDLVYDLEKKSAKLLKEGNDGWIEVNKQVLEITTYWSPEEVGEYAAYKRKRDDSKRSDKYHASVKDVIKDSRKKYEETFEEVQGFKISSKGKEIAKTPKKKAPSENKTLAKKAPQKKGGKVLAMNSRGGR